MSHPTYAQVALAYGGMFHQRTCIALRSTFSSNSTAGQTVVIKTTQKPFTHCKTTLLHPAKQSWRKIIVRAKCAENCKSEYVVFTRFLVVVTSISPRLECSKAVKTHGSLTWI